MNELDATNLYARDGHLTMLTIDRHVFGELEGARARVVIEHLDACDACRRRHERARGLARDVPPAPRRSAGVVSIGLLGAGAAVAAAASLLLWLVPSPRTAVHVEPEPTWMSSQYTTGVPVEEGPGLGLSVQDGRVIVAPETAGFLTVLTRAPQVDDGGTGGLDVRPFEPVVLGRAVTGKTTVTLAHGDQEVVALFCRDEVALEGMRDLVAAEPMPVAAPGCAVERFVPVE